MMKTIKVSDKGQIAIPNQMRETLGINRGDELVIFQVGKQILIEKLSDVEYKMKDEFKDVMKLNERSLKKVWINKSDDVWNEYLKK
jgi:AbrB family looped-hinge helix DNA binding protein